MSAWEEFLLVFGMMLVTYGVRFPVLALAGRLSMPASIERALRYVPVAVLTAITIPMLLKLEGEWFVSVHNAHLMAGLVAIVTAALSRHLLLTICVGMCVFLALRLI